MRKEEDMNATLAQRLEDCAERVGGKRALALAAGFSEAQLFRYLRGESTPDAEKLIALAKAANVDAGWLLTGEETNPKALPHDPKLYQQFFQMFEEALLEVDHPLPPALRAQIMNILYTDLLIEAKRAQFPVHLDHLSILFKIYFLLELKIEELKHYQGFMLQDWKDPSRHDPSRLESLTNHICRASSKIYSTPAGQFYFDHVGSQVWPQAAKRLDKMALQLQTQLGKRSFSLLDLGCGNGREMSYLHRHYENIEVHGVDNSDLCMKLCRQQIDAGNLPAGCVEQADLRFLPYPAESFDVV